MSRDLDSPTDYPVVQLRALGNDQTLSVLPAYWSTNLFISKPVIGMPLGYALATLFVNGIPSTSAIVSIGTPGLWPPMITNVIASQTVSSGSTVVLTAGVSGTAPLNYQWFCNGLAMVGATNATLTITNFGLANAGTYTVTVSNPSGSVTSEPALLASADIQMFNGVIVDGPLGSNYLIQVRIEANRWLTLTNVALPSQPYIYIDYDSPPNVKQTYRAMPVQ